MALTKDELIEIITTHADFINAIHFDGVLRYEVVINARFSNKWFAKAGGHDDHKKRKLKIGQIIINPAMLMATAGEITHIISHELIHVAQFHLSMKMGHGPEFKRLAKQFDLPEDVGKRCASKDIRIPKSMLAGAAPKRK